MSFKQTELGLIPDHWEYKIVSDLIAEKVLDKPLDGNHGGIHPTQKDFVEKGIPFVMASDIVDGMLDYSDCKYISLDKSKELKKGFAKEGDVLLTHKATIGRVAIVGKIDTPYIVLNPQVTYYRVLNNKKIYNQFLKYYFSWNKFNELFLAWAQGGSTRAYLGITAQQKLPIIIPPLEEQKSIAKILSDLDKKIETNNKINKKLEEMAQAIFKQWFVDFEFPNEDGKPYKSSGGEMVESELGMIPKGWEVKKLSEVISVKDGTHDSPKAKEDGFSLITSKHIKGNKILYNEAKLISKEDFDKINKRSKVDTNDILITMIGTVGNLIIVNKENVDFAIKNIGLIKTSENEEIFEFVYLYLKSKEMKNYIESRLAGSTQQYISLNELRNIPIILPKKEILTKFKKIIKSIFEQITIDIREESNLIHLRDTLLPKLMSGEIRVPID